MTRLKNIHPGEILKKEFLIPLNLNQTQLAKHINVSPRRINEIILEKRSITANTALRLEKYFNISAKFWLGLQQDYDLEEEYYKNKKDLTRIEGHSQTNCYA